MTFSVSKKIVSIIIFLTFFLVLLTTFFKLLPKKDTDNSIYYGIENSTQTNNIYNPNGTQDIGQMVVPALLKENNPNDTDIEIMNIEDFYNETQLFIMANHGSAYGVWEQSKISNRISDGSILIHFDSYHDAWGKNLEPRPQTLEETAFAVNYYGYEDFIFPAAYYGLVEEIYWVVPNTYEFLFEAIEERRSESITKKGNEWLSAKYYTASYKQKDKVSDYYYGDIQDPRIKKNEIYDREGREIILTTLNWIKSINFHIVTADSLPNFENENRSIILDIDENFFDNSDDDTFYTWGLFKNKENFELLNFTTDIEEKKYIDDRLTEFVNYLARIKKKPETITIALSPGFTPRKTMEYITNGVMYSLAKIFTFY